MSMHYYMPLPRQAGSFITSIGGKRCTAVPRNVQQSQAPSPAQPATSQPAAIQTTAQSIGTPAAANPTPTSAQQIVAPVTRVSASEQVTIPAVPQTSASISGSSPGIIDTAGSVSQTRPLQSSTSSGSSQHGSDAAKSSGMVQSSTRLSRPSSTSNSAFPTSTDDAPLVNPPPQSTTNKGAIVGGVMGVFVVLALISLLLFFCRRRRKRRGEHFEALPSPPPSATREKFYEIDNGSLGPSKKTTKWKREIASRAENAAWGLRTAMYDMTDALRETISRDRAYSPSIISARADAQRYHDSVGTHSRNNSVLTTSSGQSSLRERLARWRGRFGEVWQPQKQGVGITSPIQQSASPRQSLAEIASRYRDSDQSGSVTTSNLGLTLMNSQTSDLLRMENQPRDPFQDPYAYEDPFCDPMMEALKPITADELPQSNPFAAGDNPFTDPEIVMPASSVPKPQTYVQHVRRSRGSSFSSGAPSSNRSSRNSDLISFVDRPTSMTMTSPRFPSTIAPSHASDRSTIYSSFSAERRGKGRSDPFDLDRADIYSRMSPKNRPKVDDSMQSANSTSPNVSRIKSMIEEEKKRGHHRYESSIRYSSGVDSLEDWEESIHAIQNSAPGTTNNGSNAGLSGVDDPNHARADSEIEFGKPAMYSKHKIMGSLTEFKVSTGNDKVQELGKN